MATIHPSAIVDGGASLASDVTIGPFCVIGPDVSIGEGARLVSHVVVEGVTRIGAESVIHPFAVLGSSPQDLKYRGERTRLEIGRRTVIREHATLNTGTEGGGGLTRVGDDCLIMVGAHVAHDCLLGDHIIMANHATLGGHVTIDDYAILGGLSAVLQHIHIGAHAFIGGMVGVDQDVIPYGMVTGERGRLAGLNLVGLRRRGFSRDAIHSLRAAFRLLFREEGEMAERIARVEAQHGGVEPVRHLLEFLDRPSRRMILKPRDDA